MGAAFGLTRRTRLELTIEEATRVRSKRGVRFVGDRKTQRLLQENY
jgi:hypothetical protein